MIRAFIERVLSPGLGTCYRCNRPWKHHKQKRIGPNSWQQLDQLRFHGKVGVKEHVTEYSESGGCFPLCENCWAKLSPTKRLPYYRKLWDTWNHAGFWIQYADGSWHEWTAPEPWPVIEAAVLNEELAA